MNEGLDEEADPFRAQLHSRWEEYLSTGQAADDHGQWITMALAYYRDEIVHYGAQLLNDSAIRPWDAETSQARFMDYQDAAHAYDADPPNWEAAFWARVRRRASAGSNSPFDGQEP
ncbi:hypothetical protein [Agromyces sp. NPDC056965]|uniref:hypothetical protein n=1 Tax=Agromyces sp. NPDC056965 TaxID=3345983 RepID=UPI003626D441